MRARGPYLWLTLGPALGLVAVVFLGPFLYLLWLSATNVSLARAGYSFVGWGNFVRAFASDSGFLDSLLRSVLFAGYCVLPQVLVALSLAEALHGAGVPPLLLSPVLLLPTLLPPVVIGLYGRVMLQGEFGVLSYYFSRLGLPGAKRILSTPGLVLPTVALVDFWQWCPFVLLVLLATRSNLPKAPLEASWLDGASRLRAYLDVTLPAMLPTVFFLALLRAIDSFKEFDKIYVMTGGGPGSASELSSLFIWRTAFKSWDFGYAAALSVIVYAMILVATQLLLRIRGLRVVQ